MLGTFELGVNQVPGNREKQALEKALAKLRLVFWLGFLFRFCLVSFLLGTKL